MLSPVRTTSLLKLECIALDVPASTTEAVFQEVGRMISASHGLQPCKVSDRLQRREIRRSTGLGYGLALPHADTYSLTRPVSAFIRLREPLPFAAPDGQPVTNVLVLLVPRPAMACHNDLLTHYTRLLRQPEFRKMLNQCDNVSSIWQLFDEYVRW